MQDHHERPHTGAVNDLARSTRQKRNSYARLRHPTSAAPNDGYVCTCLSNRAHDEMVHNVAGSEPGKGAHCQQAQEPSAHGGCTFLKQQRVFRHYLSLRQGRPISPQEVPLLWCQPPW
jgi:hypothetical protein